MLRLLVWILVLTAVSAQTVAARQSGSTHGAVPVVHAVQTNTPITVDGHLNEEVWLRAPAATEFTQRDPDEGKPATERTELRIAYDGSALYVGARMYDREPSRIARQLARRDRDAEADALEIYLDPHHDHLTGARFNLSAAGVQGDATIYNDSWQDDSWDAVWQSAVKIDAEGWTAEMRIPYSQLRFPAADHHTFGINVMRYIQRKKERDWLVFVPKTESGLASRFGHLEGLAGIAAHRSVELLPYAVSRAEFVAPSAPGDPFNDGARMFGGTGLDLKYRLSSNLSLDGTINPDFGQVEVDPAVVNLTAFETFFEEKRPFFIEGSNIFNNFGRGGANGFWGFNRSEPMIFYSRRIGRAPQGSAEGDFVDIPTATTILGAAKLTGKTHNGWSIGLLDAVTGRERAGTITNGVQRAMDVEPPANYFVGRVEREIGRRGAVGALATAVDRDLHAPALRDLLSGHAYVGGADAHYFLDAKRDWVVTGRIAGSYVAGNSSAIAGLQRAAQRYYQRPDAPHLELDPNATSLTGWTGSLNLNRNSGVHGLNAAWWSVSPGFESGDAGFNFNADRAGMHVVYQYRNPKVNRFARERFVGVAKFYTWNFAREVQTDGLFTFGHVQFRNYWSLFGVGTFFRHAQDDRATRGGPSMRSPAGRGFSLELESDERRRLSIELDADVNRNEFGGFSRRFGVELRYRPSASLEISSGPAYDRSRELAQYVDTFADPAAATFGSRYVFATLNQKQFSLQTRVNFVLSPKVSMQVYMQPLVSVGDYGTFKELARPRTFDFARFGVDRGMLSYDGAAQEYLVNPGDGGLPFRFGNPDFNFKSLRLNAIFRWEWRLGSTMYVVWTEQREDSAHPGNFMLGRDLQRTFTAPGNDILMFKIAYWFQK